MKPEDVIWQSYHLSAEIEKPLGKTSAEESPTSWQKDLRMGIL